MLDLRRAPSVRLLLICVGPSTRELRELALLPTGPGHVAAGRISWMPTLCPSNVRLRSASDKNLVMIAEPRGCTYGQSSACHSTQAMFREEGPRPVRGRSRARELSRSRYPTSADRANDHGKHFRGRPGDLLTVY